MMNFDPKCGFQSLEKKYGGKYLFNPFKNEGNCGFPWYEVNNTNGFNPIVEKYARKRGVISPKIELNIKHVSTHKPDISPT